MSAIKKITTIREMQAYARRLRREDQTIVLVPTMGFFHEGHLSLMRKGQAMGDALVVSIFVNPTQFEPGEDFKNYPRDFSRDMALAENEGVDVVFAPDTDAFYGDGFQTYVALDRLPGHLCGRSRPSHFRGVSTVVCKLFNAVLPHSAVFGRKDYQQLLVVRRMVEDLNLDIVIVAGETVREADGLAMSSRNKYLTDAQRRSASALYQGLCRAQALVDSGCRKSAELVDTVMRQIESYPEAAIDYVTICDPDTLEQIDTVDRAALMALAVTVGKTRLIDNMTLRPNRL
jgi:pantoate--beta-alanine ligase